MGYAIARAALKAGHSATLITGPTNLNPPNKATCHQVKSAHEMFVAVKECINEHDVAIFCAAVADYTPINYSTEKIKKTEGDLTIELKQTKDILGSARNEFQYKGILVGFAAESENLLENAKKKLKSKGCDLIAANDISQKELGFESENNHLHLLFADGRHIDIPTTSKIDLGISLISHCQELQHEASS